MSETEPTDLPRAVVREIDGRLVLDDPDALAFVRAVEKHNCRGTLDMNADRVAHFKSRLAERGLTPQEAVITLVNVDDPQGAVLAEVLMPSHDWQAYRDRGEVPFARGLASREGVQDFLDVIDEEASAKLRDVTELSVVVVDHGVAEIFSA
jgi:hypothetical protein